MKIRLNLGWVVLLVLWLPTLYLFAGQWAAYPEYRYGWAVPFLCGFLLWNRRSFPALLTPLPPAQKGFERSRHRAPVCFLIVFGLAVILLPLYVLQEANPIWRAVSWGLALCLVGISLGVVYLLAGNSSLRCFAGPFLFFLVAVPWPTDVEHAVVELLTRLNTGTTVESLILLGTPAVQRGNVIELANAVVGIDDACSGIRSIQANLMLALFLGEYHRFKSASRIGLVGFGFLFAILFNFARTLLLTLIASRRGVEAMNHWHDLAGTLVLLGCFTALWLTSQFLRRRSPTPTLTPALDPPSPGALSLSPFPALDRSATSSHFAPRTSYFLALALWGSMIPVISEVWFRVHESKAATETEWRVPWPPAELPTLETVSISDSVRSQLLFDEGGSVRWRDPDGSLWQLFYFRWLPARNIFRRVEVQFAKTHRPEICLPATGRALKERMTVALDVHGVAVPFEFYRFEDRGRPLHVYLNVRDESMSSDAFANMRADSRERLRAAWMGNRAAGQQSLQFAVWGIPDERESRNRLTRHLRHFIPEKQNDRGVSRSTRGEKTARAQSSLNK